MVYHRNISKLEGDEKSSVEKRGKISSRRDARESLDEKREAVSNCIASALPQIKTQSSSLPGCYLNREPCRCVSSAKEKRLPRDIYVSTCKYPFTVSRFHSSARAFSEIPGVLCLAWLIKSSAYLLSNLFCLLQTCLKTTSCYAKENISLK